MERRLFLKWTAAALGMSLLEYPFAVAAVRESSSPMLLTGEEWTLLEAICARILPPVHGISTAEAGCVNFIDKLLASEEAALAPAYRKALAAFERAVHAEWRQGFAGLDAGRQIELLQRLEDGELTAWPAEGLAQAEFFGLLRWQVLLGFLADPRYGGNRGGVGWKALGHVAGHLHRHGGISDEQLMGAAPL